VSGGIAVRSVRDVKKESESVYGKGEAIPVTGREGPQVYEMSRLLLFVENRLTDGSEIFGLTLWPAAV
jgi:hypothetical protein